MRPRLTETMTSRRKTSYSTFLKDSLRESVDDLELCYQRWDASWFLITRLADPKIDAEVSKRIPNQDPFSLRRLDIVGALREAHHANANNNSRPFGLLPSNLSFYLPLQVKYSTGIVAVRSDNHAAVIVNKIEYLPGLSEDDVSGDLQRLARVLSKPDPLTCNLLTCNGVKRNVDTAGKLQNFSLVFQMPPVMDDGTKSLIAKDKIEDLPTIVSNHLSIPLTSSAAIWMRTNVRSLRELLLHRSAPESLNYLIIVARSIARALIFLHGARFVHKSI